MYNFFGRLGYIHRFKKRTADSGLSFNSMMTMVFVQLDECLKQFREGRNGEHDSTGNRLDELQILLSLVADINDEKVLKSAKDNNLMRDIIAEVKELSENKEVRAMLLAEKYAQADINAVRSYERNEGRHEGIHEGLAIAARMIADYQSGMSDEQIAFKYGYGIDEIKAVLGH